MRRTPRSLAVVAGLVVVASAAVVVWSAKPKVTPELYKGKEPRAAAQALLELAEIQAGKGSFELIYVGRVYHAGGFEDQGRALFDRVIAESGEAGDWIRIGRAYLLADDWENAKPAFDKALAMEPDDADWLLEVGAYYNLRGDRARAEELFDRAFTISPNDLRNTLDAAGSYVGVLPRGRL